MLRQYLDLDGLVYLWSKIKANFTNVIESISVNGTRQSVIDKNVNIEIPQSMPLTDVDSTPTCNSTNLVTSGGVYNFVGTQIGTKAEDTTVVHKSGTETISGNKTFSGTTTFTGITNLGSKATATTPAATDNDTSVATTAFVKTAISGKQDTLVSGTNIKTVDNCSLIGSGNIDTYRIFTLPSGTEESDNSIITAAMSDTGYVHTDSENLYIASVFNKNIALEVPFYSNVILRPLVNGRCTNNTVTFWNEMTDNGVTMSFSVSINANTGQATYKIIQSTGIDESNLVHKTGDEDISGNKNFGLINAGQITVDGLINAGRITVCGEDVVRTSDLATKLDKPTSSTDNAVVRFDGTTGNIQNSGVTINDSNQVTAAKFITSGGTSSQVVLGNGNLQAANTLPQYEAYLEWGGKNFSGNYGVADAAMVDELGAPRTMFAKAAGIVVEYSRDGGSTWIDYEATDDQKTALFSSGTNLYIGKSNTAGASSADYMLRVTLRTSAAGIYTTLNKFVIFIGSNGSQGCYCTIRTRLQSNYENDVDTWVTMAEQIPIAGRTGYNVININGFTTYGNGKTSQYGEIQFIFGCTGYSGSSSGLNISKIFGFGGVGWVTPSNMAKTGHLYAFDYAQNATFPNQIEAVKFKKSGGTSSQFLKADGSVDSNTYLTTAPVTSVNGQTGAVTGLAPLASPALTGTPTAPTAASGTKTDQIATTCFVQKAVAASAGSDVNWNNDKSCLTKTLNGTTTSIVNATTITQAGAPSIIADASCTCAQKNRRAYSARYIDSTFATIADVEEKQPMIVHFTNENDTWTADTSINDIATAAGEGRTIWGEALMLGNARMQLIMYYENFIAVFGVSSGTGMIGLTGQIQNDNDVWTYEELTFPTEFKTINNTSITGSGDISLPTTERVDEIEETTAAALNELNSNKLSWDDTTNTLDQSTNLPTSSAVYSAIQTAIQGIPTPMQFKGSLGTGGTYTASTLPAASSANKGWTVKVITAGTYRNVAAKVGDVLVSDGSAWVLIPSGDEPSGTVTSVGLSMPTGFSVSGSPVTSSGTLAVSMTSGYGIPTTTQMTNWSNKQDAISDLQTIRSNACTGASKVSNVQSDWNATSGLAQILNKPTVISSIGYSAPAGYITANNSNAIQLTMCTSSGRKLNIGGSSWQITSTTEPSSSTDKDLVAPTWSAMASALSGKANSATTLSGYGITDAKIANGTITLGSNSITPLTSHQTLKTINSTSLVGSGNISIPVVSGGSGVNAAPTGGTGSQITIGGTAHYFVSTKSYCSSSDANVAPSWSAMVTCLTAVRSEISGSAVTIYTGTSAPTSSTGVNGDIYIQTSCA